MSGTRFDPEDFDSVLLQLGCAHNLLALMLGHQRFQRLKDMVWYLHQTLNDETVSIELIRLIKVAIQIFQNDEVKALLWVCSRNKGLGDISPLECLFDEKLYDEPFNLVKRMRRVGNS